MLHTWMWQLPFVLLAMGPVALGGHASEEPDDFDGVECYNTSLCAAEFGNASCKNIDDDIVLSGQSTCPKKALCLCVESVEESDVIPCHSNLDCRKHNGTCVAVHGDPLHSENITARLLDDHMECPSEHDCICLQSRANRSVQPTPQTTAAPAGNGSAHANRSVQPTPQTTAAPAGNGSVEPEPTVAPAGNGSVEPTPAPAGNGSVRPEPTTTTSTPPPLPTTTTLPPTTTPPEPTQQPTPDNKTVLLGCNDHVECLERQSSCIAVFPNDTVSLLVGPGCPKDAECVCVRPRNMTTQTTTIEETTVTTTTAATTTTTKSTVTAAPGKCVSPDLDKAVDVSECTDLTVGKECVVKCKPGYVGTEATIKCQAAGLVIPNIDCAATTSTTTTSMTTTSMTTFTSTLTTTTVPVLCTEGLPSSPYVDKADCEDKYNGHTCTVSCTGSFTGTPATYSCTPGKGSFSGTGPVCEEIKCQGGFPAGNYDNSSCADKSVGEFCQVSCLPGYTGRPAVFTCNMNGLFSTEQSLVCNKTTCGKDSMPSGYGVTSDCAGKVFEDSCTASCRAGFVGNETTFTCGQDGDFEGTSPTCSPQPCKVPERLQNALFSHDCDGIRNGEQCRAGCAQGYSGTPMMQSCQLGNLTGNDPTCTPEACTTNMPSGLGVNTSDCDGKGTDESCTLTCKPGYMAAASNSSLCSCQNTGAFTDCSVTCTKVPCLQISSAGSSFNSASLAHSCDGVVFGEACSVFCADGYSISGNAVTLRCTARGAFAANVAPTCSPKECKYNIPRGLGMTNTCDGKGTGQSCVAEVLVGYAFPDGDNKTVECKATGEFLPVVPETTLKECPAPEFGNALKAGGAQSSCDGEVVNGECWAYCGTNLALYACQAVGNEIKNMPKDGDLACRRMRRLAGGSCTAASVAAVSPPITAPEFKNNCNGTANAAKCVVECNDGFSIAGNAILYTCDAGSLSGSGLPNCTAKLCNYSAPDGIGVTSNCSGVGTNGKCIATCGEGYNYAQGTGEQTFTCGPYGRFDGTNPSCVASACNPLSSPGNQYDMSQCEGKVTLETCFVSCSVGWTISGPPALYTCQTSGQLTKSGALPNCTANVCTENMPSGADINATGCIGTTTGKNCTVTCANGYEGGSGTYGCKPSGALELYNGPTCNPLTCSNNVPAMQGVTNNCDNITFRKSCTLGCDKGYKIKEGTTVPQWTCVYSAGVELQGNAIQCEPLPCTDNIPLGDSFKHNCSNPFITTGQSCEAACAAGYTGTPTILTCLARTNRALSGQPPSCVKQKCSSAESPSPKTTFTCAAQVSYLEFCPLSCAEGYRGSPRTYECKVDGLSVSLKGGWEDGMCAAEPCKYGKPTGSQYSHDCGNLLTGQTCTVSCADGYSGDPQSFSCLPNSSFVGTLPVCDLIITTRTTTITTLTTRTMTMTTSSTATTTVTTVPDTVITGTIKMVVSNPHEFVKNPNFTAAVADGIASALNLPTEWVTVNLSVAPARMLAMDATTTGGPVAASGGGGGGSGGDATTTGGPGAAGGGQAVASGEIQVDYTITIPGTPSVAHKDAPSPANVTASLGAADPQVFQAKISDAVQAADPAGTFNIEVKTISYEVISGPANLLPTTTTLAPTTTMAAPTTTSARQGRGLPTTTTTVDDDHTARDAAIVIVFIILFMLMLCGVCICLVFPDKFLPVKTEREQPLQPVQPVSGADLGGSGRQELNVIPVQGAPPDGRWAVSARGPMVAVNQQNPPQPADDNNPPGVVVDADVAAKA